MSARTTTTTRTTYDLDDGIATIAMDDGKANAFSIAMLGELGERLDRAEADEAVVVLTSGRPGLLSGGFDLKCPPEDWPGMVRGGAELAERLLAFPHPVVVACPGSAVAMAAFVLLSADVRIGVPGPYRIGLNEVAIGLTLPWFGVELARHRLTPPAFDRCTVTGPLLGPEAALAAGFLDELAEPADLGRRAHEVAATLKGIDRRAHAATKLRTRAGVLDGVRAGIARLDGPVETW